MRVGLGTSARGRVVEAAQEATEQVLGRLGGHVPDAAVLVATAAWGESALRELVTSVANGLACDAIVGGSVDGILVGKSWVSHRPAIGLLALTGVDFSVGHWEGSSSDAGRAALELAIGQPSACPGDLMILFVDSLGLSPRPILQGLAASLPGLPIVGIGTSEPEGASPLVWAGSHVGSGACAALTIRSKHSVPSIGVTHACRRVGPIRIVTRARGHWILGLDGREALEVLRETDGVVAAGRTPLVGLLGDGSDSSRDDEPMTVRNVVGFDEDRGGFAISEEVRPGTRLVALVPDTDSRRLAGELGVRGEPAQMLGSGAASTWGLYLACRAAGGGLLAAAQPGGALADAMGCSPLLAVSAAYQIAPSAVFPHKPELHTHAGIAAVSR